MKMFKIIFAIITFTVFTVQSVMAYVTSTKIYGKFYDIIYEKTGDYVKAAIVAFILGCIVLVPVWAAIGILNGKLLRKIYEHFSA